MKIRLLEKKDIAAAARTAGINFGEEYAKTSKEELLYMFGKGPIKPVYYVAEENNVILGFAGYIQSWADYDMYEIFWVSVLPERQRQGIGKKLVSKLITEIKKHKNACTILLTADSEKGNDFYYEKNFGFKSVDALNKGIDRIMTLSIES